MFTKDFTKPEPVRPMIPDSVRHTVRAAQDAGRREVERANLNMPFRARLRARDGVRPQSTLAIITNIQNRAAASPPPRGPLRALRTVSSNPGALPLGMNGKGGVLSGGGHDDDDNGNRLSDISQFAFASIAVLGLAGLSVMAAESALNGGSGQDAGPLGELDPSLAPTSSASSVAMAAVSAPREAAPTQWFDYQGLADRLAANKVAYDTAQREAAAVEAEQARQQAANAIADAEALRVAETAAQDAEAERARLDAAEVEKTRLAEAEAARVAEAEQVRLADLKAQEDAAAAIEAKRLADLETRRVAEAEAETRRLADLKARADAKAEQKRLAALAVENQKRRLAAAAAEESRLAALTASAVVPVGAASPVQADAAPVPARVRQMVAHTGAVPAPASLKPARPVTVLAALPAPTTPTSPTPRALPAPAYAPTTASVRPFQAPSQPIAARTADDFLAERVEVTAAQALDSNMLNVLRADFLRLVDTQPDTTTQTLQTPDGRPLNIAIERSISREASRPSVRTVAYPEQATDMNVRLVSDVIPLKVSVVCRDIAYAFPGQERGRFAACQSPDGGWVLGRASDAGSQDFKTAAMRPHSHGVLPYGSGVFLSP